MIKIFNKDLKCVGAIREASNFTFIDRLNDVGDFSFDCKYDRDLFSNLVPRNYIEVNEDLQGIIETVSYDKKRGIISVAGHSLIELINRAPNFLDLVRNETYGKEMWAYLVEEGSSSEWYPLNAVPCAGTSPNEVRNWLRDQFSYLRTFASDSNVTYNTDNCPDNKLGNSYYLSLKDKSLLWSIQEAVENCCPNCVIEVSFEFGALENKVKFSARAARRLELSTDSPILSDVVFTKTDKGYIDSVSTEYAGPGYDNDPDGSYVIGYRLPYERVDRYPGQHHYITDRVKHMSATNAEGNKMMRAEERHDYTELATAINACRAQMRIDAKEAFTKVPTLTCELTIYSNSREFEVGDIITLKDDELGENVLQLTEIQYTIINDVYLKYYTFEQYNG